MVAYRNCNFPKYKSLPLGKYSWNLDIIDAYVTIMTTTELQTAIIVTLLIIAAQRLLPALQCIVQMTTI